MPFMIETFDKPGHEDLRLQARDVHLDYLDANAELLIACGAKLADDGAAATGGLYLLDVESRGEAEKFIEADPFHQAELFERVVICRWRKAYVDGKNLLETNQSGHHRMLFQVEMTVRLPHDMPSEQASEIKARERAYSQQLQRNGKWRHLWRVAGSYANVSIFDVGNNAELQDIISALPLFPYMDICVKPLCRHPSSVHEDDR